MGIKMVKFKPLYDKDKETAWVNQMAAEGYALTGFFFGFYKFVKSEPGEYIYQIDFTKGFFHAPRDYREFMEEAGVEIVSAWGPWVFLRKKAEDGPFELYTDAESTYEHYFRIRSTLKAVILVEFICMAMEIIGGIQGTAAAWVMALVIGAITLLIINEVNRINGILDELRERMGMESEDNGLVGKRRISLFLPLGFLSNLVAMLIQNPAYAFAQGIFIGLGVSLIVAGIIFTFWKRR